MAWANVTELLKSPEAILNLINISVFDTDNCIAVIPIFFIDVFHNVRLNSVFFLKFGLRWGSVVSSFQFSSELKNTSFASPFKMDDKRYNSEEESAVDGVSCHIDQPVLPF